MQTDITQKFIRAITPFCILLAFLAAASAAVGQVTRAKTTEELIAEVEADARNPASAPEVVADGIKSAAEILAEIEALSIPTNAETAQEGDESDENKDKDDGLASQKLPGADNEEDEKLSQETGSGTEELPVDSDTLPDEVIGEYAVDQDDEDGLDLEVIDATDAGTIASASETALETTASETLYEKADALEPQLMMAGTPEDDEDEALISEKLSGRIIAEKKPIARRRHVYRWVLKTEDGRRIPLKSNIKLLQEVRRDNILDSEVSLTGRYISSGLNDNLRYFVVESAVILEDEPSDEKAAKKDKKKTSAAAKTGKTAAQKQK